MHHFVVKFSKFSWPQAARGDWPPQTKILRTFLVTSFRPVYNASWNWVNTAQFSSSAVHTPKQTWQTHGRTATTFDELCDTADDELFSKAVQLSNHVLHALLPPSSTASQRYHLRHTVHTPYSCPTHSTQLSDSNFLAHMLYTNTY